MMTETLKQHRWDLQAQTDDARRGTMTQSEFDPQQIMRVAGRWIGEHPVVCVSAAMAIGMVVGCLIKRR